MELQDGQRLVVLQGIEARCFADVNPMVAELRTVTIPAGEILVVTIFRRSDSLTVSVTPHRYQELEPQFVDPEVRGKDGYRGYHLVIERAAIDRCCRPISGRS
jgi:hypothetical protein